MRGIFSLFLFAVSACVCCAAGAAGAFFDGSDSARRRLKLLEDSFAVSLAAEKIPYGVVCIAENGKIVAARIVGIPEVENGAELKKLAEKKSLPLGETSLAAVSFGAAKMAEYGRLDLDWRVSDRFSRYTPPSGTEKYATFRNMLDMRAGVAADVAGAAKKCSEVYELFGLIAQSFPTGGQGGRGVYSPMCAAAVGYALGYESDKSIKNPKKAFVAFMKRYFFAEIGVGEPKYRAFDSALFPAYAVALTPAECAAWLAAESSAAAGSAVFDRRVPTGGSRFAAGWTESPRGGLAAQTAAAFYGGCASEVAVFPSRNVAAAFFAVSGNSGGARGAKAAAICRKMSDLLGEMLANR